MVIAGGKVDLSRIFGRPPTTAVELPLYPWQHAQFAVSSTVEASTILDAAHHPLLGRRPRQDSGEWFSTVDTALFPWIADHKVAGVAVFPAVAFIDVMLCAGQELFPDAPLDLRDLDIVRPLVFDGHTSFETLVRLSRETGLTEFLSRARATTSDWTLHARGVVGRSPTLTKSPVKVDTPAGTVAVAQRNVYESAAKLGFDYGPAFQRAQLVAFPHPKRAIVTLGPVDERIGDRHVVDLAGIDSAFHALFASEDAGVADMPIEAHATGAIWHRAQLRTWRDCVLRSGSDDQAISHVDAGQCRPRRRARNGPAFLRQRPTDRGTGRTCGRSTLDRLSDHAMAPRPAACTVERRSARR